MPEPATLLDMFYTMLLANALDLQMVNLYSQGELPAHLSGLGQEGCQVGAAFAMDRSRDWLLPYYRDLALVLAWGMTAYEILQGAMAHPDDPSSGGRQRGGQYSQRERRIVSGSGLPAAHLPHAVGIALAARRRREECVVLASFGEGACGAGSFHEALVLSSAFRVPVVFFCQHNQYAFTVPNPVPQGAVAKRAEGYGLPGVAVQGNDTMAVYNAVAEAAARARRGDGPTLVEAWTYCLFPDVSDPEGGRDRQEVEEWRRRGPLLGFRSYLEMEGVLAHDRSRQMQQRVAQVVSGALSVARAAPVLTRDDSRMEEDAMSRHLAQHLYGNDRGGGR